MNSLRYIHAADLHLDTPFLGLSRTDAGEALQAQLRDATFTALQRLFDQCERLRPDFLVLAGDIYNQEELISGPEMVKRGEIDQATISSDILDSWLADDTTKDMVSMERPETGKSYFYFFNFLPYAHQFSNWNTTGVDAQYQPDNWAKAVNSTNFRKAFLYAIRANTTPTAPVAALLFSIPTKKVSAML